MSKERIPQEVIDAYVKRWPHLATLSKNVNSSVSPAAARTFAQNVCRLTQPEGVSIRQVHGLACVANGEPFHDFSERRTAR